jgi:gamma-glutamylcyclotransferase (GGCT)/AIG2-like uncharacterized protein YtfP
MHDLGSFPAVTPGKNYIQGEVWKVSKWLESEIDQIEGYGGKNKQNLYNKVTTQTTLGPAEMYIIDMESAQAWGQDNNQVVQDGDTFIWNL